MIAAITTAKTKTSFQEIFFNDLFPFKVIFNPPVADGALSSHESPREFVK